MRNFSLIVASIFAWLTLAASAPAQQPDKPTQGQNAQPIPDAPQPQKKPAAKPQPPPDASSGDSPTAPPADTAAPKPPPAKDDNAFPEAVSRQAAKAAAAAPPDGDTAADGSAAPPAQGSTKHPSADANPFPESVSRDAAKAAGNDPAPAPPAKTDLPPGVSSSQSESSSSAQENEPQVTDPARAKKDTEVGGYYLKTGDYQGALLRYKDATAADPTNVAAIFGLAESQRSLGKNAEAARYYQMYLDIVPNGPKSKEAIKALKTLQPGK